MTLPACSLAEFMPPQPVHRDEAPADTSSPGMYATEAVVAGILAQRGASLEGMRRQEIDALPPLP